MNLSEREKRILEAIIEAYIATAEPVGSKTLVDRASLGLSSATIRNEMSELEEKGLLDKPHTSAGRVPSQGAYRLYVDSLMKKHMSSEVEKRSEEMLMQLRIGELDRFISEASRVISKLTAYPTVAVSQKLKQGFIRRFDILPVDLQNFVLVVATSAGIIKSKIFHLDGIVPDEVIRRFCILLNEKLTNVTVEKITLPLILSIEAAMQEYGGMVSPILRFIGETIEEIDDNEVFLEGSSNIFRQPEYRDIEKAKEFLSFLEKKEEVAQMLERQAPAADEGVRIVIGRENQLLQMQETSVIIGNYRIGGRVVGAIGIIGPTRMDYSRVVPHLELFTNNINKLLTQTFFSAQEDGGPNR